MEGGGAMRISSLLTLLTEGRGITVLEARKYHHGGEGPCRGCHDPPSLMQTHTFRRSL